MLNIDRFNRQLHPDERTLAKQLAEKSGVKYTDQMRIMNGLIVGDRESGGDTFVGQVPTDSGARWQCAGTTENGKPILTQITAPPLQLPQALGPMLSRKYSILMLEGTL